MPLALAVLLCLAQQGDPVLAGRVVDGAGKPVAEAKVTMLARPIPFHIDPTREHRVVATTDAHGAFRAALHADGVYSVWAATASAASAVAEGESAPGFVELRLLHGTGPRTVPFSGLDAWSEAATFRYRALVGGENLDFAPVTLRDGTLVLPPLPPLDRRAIEILRADDGVLWSTDANGEGVGLPAPATWTVCAVDDRGEPLAGVEVLAHVCNYWATESEGVATASRYRDLWPSQGTTGADGTLTQRRPRSDSLWLLSRKDGFAASIDGYHGKYAMHGCKLVPLDSQPPPDHFDVRLSPALPLVMSLITVPGAPLAADTLFVTARVYAKAADGGGFGMPFSFAASIVERRASAQPLPERSQFEAAATTFARDVREQLRERFGFAPAALRLPETALPCARFDSTHWRALTVTTSDGRPAANTPVFLGTSSPQGAILRTDRRGRLLFEAAAPQRVSVYARAGFGTAVVEGREAKLELRATRPTAVRVVDLDGKAIAGMRVALEIQRQSSEEPGEYRPLASLLRFWSDEEGRVEVPMPPFTARVVLTAASSSSPPRLELDWDPERPAELVLTVPQR